MNKSFLITTYFFVVVFSIIVIWGLVKMIRNERFIKYENTAASKQEFMKKHERKFDICAKILFIIGALVLVWSFIIPAVLDFPNVGMAILFLTKF